LFDLHFIRCSSKSSVIAPSGFGLAIIKEKQVQRAVPTPAMSRNGTHCWAG
jgi:hypothetical protein